MTTLTRRYVVVENRLNSMFPEGVNGAAGRHQAIVFACFSASIPARIPFKTKGNLS